MSWLESGLSIFLPRPCPVCGGQGGPAGAGVCVSCRAQMGQALRHGPRTPAVDASWFLAPYKGPLGTLLVRSKLGCELPLIDAVGGWLAEGVAVLPRVDAVVPVQAHWLRVLRRGMDLPVRLARPVALRMNAPLLLALRHSGAGSQLGRGRVDRIAVESDRFCVTRAVPPRILLVDDVRTTGATADSCARALRAAGASWVGLLTPVSRSLARVKKS